MLDCIALAYREVRRVLAPLRTNRQRRHFRALLRFSSVCRQVSLLLVRVARNDTTTNDDFPVVLRRDPRNARGRATPWGSGSRVLHATPPVEQLAPFALAQRPAGANGDCRYVTCA